MAKCELDLSHPNFRIIGNASDADLQSGLDELRNKLARDHRITGFFSQPMPKFPDYQNKIWVWDFAPEGDTTRTRKGWRLFAYVEGRAAAEPIPAVGFVCWDKQYAPKSDYAKYLAEILKKFLSDIIVPESVPERFKHQTHPDGRIISLCYQCYEPIFSENMEEAELAESAHECSVSDIAAQEDSN